jgi:hypothetical protein
MFYCSEISDENIIQLNMKTKVIITTITFILACFIGEAREVGSVSSKGIGNLSGKIRDKTTSRPVEFANIELFSATDSSFIAGTISNTEGNFNIVKLVTGQYFVKINYPGFEKIQLPAFSINSNPCKIDFGEVYLSPVAKKAKNKHNMK